MRGSCVLSAVTLVVIAGMLTRPLPTRHHSLDVAAMAALASLTDEQITLLTAPITSLTTNLYHLPSLTNPGYRELSPVIGTAKFRQAIYPQPASYYLSQESTATLVDTLSPVRRAKLTDLTTSPTSSPKHAGIQDLLPTIQQFLTLLSQEKSTKSEKSSDTWVEASYLQKYGCQYATPPSMDGKEETKSNLNNQPKSDTWTQAPYFHKYGYRYAMSEDSQTPEETSAEKDTTSEKSSNKITYSWFGLDEIKEDATVGNLASQGPHGDGHYATYDEQTSGMNKDYANEYDEYEDIIYEPLREEANYYDDSDIDEGISPPSPNGSFDIYWEETDPNLL